MTHRLIFSGQPRRYSDTYHEYEISGPAEATLTDILEYIRDALGAEPLPTREEWLNSDAHGDAGYYFRGWCNLRRDAPGVWRYVICKPYTG